MLARVWEGLGDVDRAKHEHELSRRLREEYQAMADLRGALARHPADDELRCAAARWMLAHDREPAGLEFAHSILQRKPGHSATVRLLADYYERKGNAGLANYYRMMDSKPGDTKRR
jgi:hypothetical protein